MIELTREEALEILQALSRVEGYLYSVQGSVGVMETIDPVVEMLAGKLAESD